LVVPELPEVEVLVRQLQPLLRNKKIREVVVNRPKVLAPTSVRQFTRVLTGARIKDISRRGKYLLFSLRVPGRAVPVLMLGHLGMTGRMYLLPSEAHLPKHAAVVLRFGVTKFVYEDTRYFGRLTLDTAAIEGLGPEPLDGSFTAKDFAERLKRSSQAIKIKLLDQSLVAGVGNIYASEALFHAGISPRVGARRLTKAQVRQLWQAIREVLVCAIECGSTVPLNFSGIGSSDRLFYFGKVAEAPNYYEERLRVYDRENSACPKCGERIRRIVQVGRSTFYCAKCQRG
jgi:formamidopyrimidine-DNA glycosylase